MGGLFHGLSHVDVPVRDLKRALKIYRDGLGFPVKAEGEGWVDLDAATAIIRLLESRQVERPASLRIEAVDIEAAVKALAKAGAEVLYEAGRTDDLTVEGTVRDRDNNTIIIWRALSEDEYDFDPDLPTELTWKPEAEALLKSMLKSVPALFRGLARRKVVKEAERRAGGKGLIDEELVVRSYISAQSPPTRPRARKPIREHGFDPDDYADEFDD